MSNASSGSDGLRRSLIADIEDRLRRLKRGPMETAFLLDLVDGLVIGLQDRLRDQLPGEETGFRSGERRADRDGPDDVPLRDDGLEEVEEDVDLPPEDPAITHPLVFVPGIMGSQLFLERPGSQDIRVWPPFGATDRGSLSLIAANRPKLADGLFPGAYEELTHALKKMGYVENRNFFVFPYDWTLSNKTSGRRLFRFIERILARNEQWNQVDVLAHSMGGLVVRAALIPKASELATPARIRRKIYLGSPHYGAVKAYCVLNRKIGLDFGGFFRRLLAEAAWDAYVKKDGDPSNLEDGIKELALQLDSVYELLPDQFYLTAQHPMVTIDNPLFPGDQQVIGVEDTYYKNELTRFPEAVRALVEDAMEFKENLGRALPGDARNNLVIYSNSEETVDQVVYDNVLNPPLPKRLTTGFEVPDDSGQQGDGTVPADSASAGLNTAIARGGTHNGVATSDPTFQLIERFLKRA